MVVSQYMNQANFQQQIL